MPQQDVCGDPVLKVLVVVLAAAGAVLGAFFVAVFLGVFMTRAIRALDAAGLFAA